MVQELRNALLATTLALLGLLTISYGADGDSNTPSTSGSNAAGICPHHTCQDGQPYATSNNQGQVMCYCDDECTFYKDCCHNYFGTRTDTASLTSCVQLNVTNSRLTVRQGVNIGYVQLVRGYQFVTKCPARWYDEISRSGCETPNKTDEISITPVTGHNRVSYRNVYCAVCNGVPFADITFWTYGVDRCGVFDEMFDYFVKDNQWYSALNAVKSECAEIQFTAPNNVELRHCILGQIADCPEDYDDRNVEESCESYIAVVPHQSELYRNAFCAQCHGKQLNNTLACNTAILPSNLKPPPPLSVLFGFQPQETQLLAGKKHSTSTSRPTCRQNEMYDPFVDKCRTLFCNYGFILTRGHCVLHINSQSNCSINHSTIAATIRIPRRPDTGTCQQIVQEQCPQFDRIFEQDYIILVNCNANSNTTDVNVSIEFTAKNISIEAIEKKLISKLGEEGNRCQLQDLRVTTKCYGNWSAHGSCTNTTHSERDISIHHDLAVVENSSFSYNLNETPYEMTYSFINANQSVVQTYTFYTCNEQCPETSYEPGTFMVNGSGSTVILTESGIALSASQFRWLDGNVVVCADLVGGKNNTFQIFQFDMIQVILTLIGSILSLIALLVSLITYVVFSSLRNLPGKSVMSFIVALFTGQFLFLFVGNATENQRFCTAVAVILHYVWLASFSWSSVIAYYLSRTLGTQPRPHATQHRDCDRKFLQFSLHGWGTPLIILIICLIIEFCSNTTIMYGTTQACWIGNNLALITAFFLPIVVTLLVNAFLYARILFFFTFRGFESNGPNMGSMDKLRKKRLKRDSIVSLKVAFLLGFTWVFAFVAYYTNLDIFWYVFIILNSSQGVYIFLAFTCTPQVINLWKLRLQLEAKPDTTSRPEKHHMVTRTSSPNGKNDTTYTQGSPLITRPNAAVTVV